MSYENSSMGLVRHLTPSAVQKINSHSVLQLYQALGLTCLWAGFCARMMQQSLVSKIEQSQLMVISKMDSFQLRMEQSLLMMESKMEQSPLMMEQSLVSKFDALDAKFDALDARLNTLLVELRASNQTLPGGEAPGLLTAFTASIPPRQTMATYTSESRKTSSDV